MVRREGRCRTLLIGELVLIFYWGSAFVLPYALAPLGLAPGDHSTLFALARLYYLPVLLVRTLAGPVSESAFVNRAVAAALGAVLTGSALALGWRIAGSRVRLPSDRDRG
jgi:hypothetical protein